MTAILAAVLAAVLGFFAYPLVLGAFGLLLSILYIAAAEHEDSDYDSVHGFAIFFTIVAGLVYCKPIIAFLSDWSWHLILLGIVAYGILGGVNSAFRWFKHCRKFVETHPTNNIRLETVICDNGKRREPTPEEIQRQIEEYYKENLKPGNHKRRLIGWIAYWPWSLFWNILGDFLTGIYDALTNVYNRISASVIKKALRS